MATQAIEQADPNPEEAAASPKAKRRLPLVPILAVLGILGGAAVGLYVVGPTLAKKRSSAPAKSAMPTGPAVVHAIENLVLNPAGSGGTRFLMVTATFELKDGNAEQAMKDREAEVRDHILALLGTKTVDELTDYTKRDAIKADVLREVASLFPKGDVKRLYFPQFVIQ